MIRRSFQDLSESAFPPFIRCLSVSVPRIWNASLFAKACCRHQSSRANSKVGYKVGNWSPPLGRETAMATTLGWPDYPLQNIHGVFQYWSKVILPPSHSTRLRGHPYKVLQGAWHRRRRGSAFWVRVVKYWNKLPTSVVTAPSAIFFKKRLENVWTENFSHVSHWLNTRLVISLLK